MPMREPDEQEVRSALDLIRDRLRREVADALPEDTFAEALLDRMRQTDPSRLLFSPSRLGEIARLAAERDPEEAAWLREIADNAMEWKFYGASNAYCRRFLELDRDRFDFSALDHEDPEALHGLNRMRWLAALGRSYWEERDPARFQALVEHWDFFVEKAPFPGEDFSRNVHAMGERNMAPPFGELDIFIRLTNWYWAYWTALFADEMTPRRNAALLARCLRLFDMVAARGVRQHAHNFTSMQMEALFLWATALKDFTGMEVWRHAARNILESSLNRAVYADGVHWEKSAGYHGGCIRWYGVSYLLGQRSGEPFAEAYGARLGRMAEYLDAILTPECKTPLLSDSDRTDSARHSLALARAILPDLKFSRCVAPTYASLWASDGETWDAGQTMHEIAPVIVFPEGGVAVGRNAGPGGAQAILDNGPTHAGHSHFDNLTVHYDLPQGPAIVDPGRWIYRAGADRAWVTHCESHNTVYIEDEPVEPGDWIRESGFATVFGPEDDRASAIREGEQDGAATLRTSFRGHTRDRGAEGDRTLVFPASADETWLAVIDQIRSPREHNWTHSWLFPASAPGRETKTGYEVDLECGVTLRFAFMGKTLLALRDEEMFWCPSYAEKSPARWVRFTSHCASTQRAFLFLPLVGTDAMPDIEFEHDRVLLDTGERRVEIEV